MPWGVQVWLPEAGGPVELDSLVHLALMTLLGAQAQREVVRARHRVMAAMGAQARLQGRFLGGRPPYGYRLADGGPHPNVMHARWGRRVHVLEPDPEAARWVRWMFAERARGRSVASLVRELNDRGVPCPSSAESSAQLAPVGSAVDRAHRRDDLGEPEIHRPTGLEPPDHQGPRLRWT
jgi:DNA invertase Pin-like site-specific DNA recombinase